MIEIRWHGRGGHGGFTAARLLGLAASVYGGNYAQAFPSFGPERRGAPVLGFTRINDKPIHDHSQVYNCDYVIVLDETLLETIDVTKGLKENGVLIINTRKPSNAFIFQNNTTVRTFDGIQLALDILGINITSTVMLGVLVGITDLVDINAVYQAIDDFLPEELRAKNKKAVRIAYKTIKGVN